MKKLTRAMALATVSAIALTGCVQVEINVDLQEDDTLSGEVITAFSQEVIELAGEDTLDQLLEAEQNIDGSVTERYESAETTEAGEPAYVGTRTTFADQPLADFDAAGEGVDIVRDGNDYVVSGHPEDLSAQTGGQELPPGAQVSLSVTFPGEVSSHNGVLEGNTVTWDLTTHTDSIEARGAASTGGFPTWLVIVIIALVGIGIGMAGVLVVSSKRKPTDDSTLANTPGEEDDFQGTVNKADAGESTVLPAAEPVVDADPVVGTSEVVDTTQDEGPHQP